MSYVCAELVDNVCVNWVQSNAWVTYAEFQAALPAIVGVILLAYTYRKILRFFR